MERFLYFRHTKTGEIAGRVDVSQKSERAIERIERGMLTNCHDDWLVGDSACDSPSDAP